MKMNTHVSIPNPIFKESQQLARKLGITLNELYTNALSSFLAQHKSGYVTEKLNKVYNQESSQIDSELIDIQLSSLDGDSW
jgi:hypothetical protein